MYFPDLSPYKYFESDRAPNVLNIGWLGGAHAYPQGQPPEGFLERLWIFCRESVNRLRGFHVCELCPRPEGYPPMLQMQYSGEALWLGSAEAWAFGDDGMVYAAPDMIFHYVVDHGYLPPAAFVQAVLNGPLPDSPEYQARSLQFGWGQIASDIRRFSCT